MDMQEMGQMMTMGKQQFARKVLAKYPEADIVRQLHTGMGLPFNPTPEQMWVAAFDAETSHPGATRSRNYDTWPEATKEWFAKHRHLVPVAPPAIDGPPPPTDPLPRRGGYERNDDR